MLRIVVIIAAALVAAVAHANAQSWIDRTGAIAPQPRHGHAMCFDPVRGYTVLVGGFGAVGAFSETWTWDGATWVDRGVTLPASQYALAYHAGTQDLLLHAGSMCRWTGQAWQAVGSGSYGAGGRVAMAYDPVRMETVLWTPSLPASVGVWDGSQLIARASANSPYFGATIAWHELAWDAAAQRLVLAIWYGGNQSRFYEWSGFGWNQRFPATLPPSGVHALSSDPTRQRLVALDGDFQALTPNHTWSYGNGACAPFVTVAEPTLRSYAAMAYDSARDVHVLFGGLNSLPMGDTWELALDAYASFAPYGLGCAGSAGTPQLSAVPGALPQLGGQFQARVRNLPPNAPSVLLIGSSDSSYLGVSLPFDLTPVQAPGCFLLASGEDLQPLANPAGVANWSLVVPPVAGATFFLQVAVFDAAANGLGIGFSNAGRGRIGL